jgi:phosphocarrier protein FPr
MAAIRGAQEETRALYEWSKAHIGADEAGIFDAQSLFLEDPELLAGVSRRLLEDRVGAESAWQTETAELAGRLGALEDPYLRARAADVADVAARVMRRLTGTGGKGAPSGPGATQYRRGVGGHESAVHHDA